MRTLLFNSRSKFTKYLYLLTLSIIFLVLFDRIWFIGYTSFSSGFYNKLSGSESTLGISEEDKDFYDTLIFGSSRTRRAIHPLYLKKSLGLNAFKIAQPGKYLKYNYLYYTLFRKKYKVPKYLFYGIDYFIFKKFSNPGRMAPIQDLMNEKSKPGLNISLKFFSPFPIPSLMVKEKENINNFINDYLGDLLKVHLKGKKEPLISEYVGRKKSVHPRKLREPRRWRKNAYARYPGLEGKYLDLLFEDLERDKVKVFLVILPDLINVYRTNYEQELFVKEIRNITKKYSNIVVLDYNSPEKFDLSNPKLFWDGQYGVGVSHLSYYGAEILNKMLCKDIKEYLKRTKSR